MIITTQQTRFMVFGLVAHGESKDRTIHKFAEVQSLVNTYGGRVEAYAYQYDTHINQTTFIGEGKIPEIIDALKKNKIEVLVINENIKPTQLFKLSELLIAVQPGLQVWDRVDLILHIFEKHAATAEAKLQIKLADIRHMGPVLFSIGTMLSRQGGGIGTRGLGETNTEIEQRHFRQAIQKIQVRLDQITENRQRQIDERKKRGLPTLSLVGYTNAGKTSLYNRLTRKRKLVEDALFATLDSSVGRVYLPGSGKEIVVTDTIGFIQNLPPELVEAFTSTLLETVEADILVHIIDVGDQERENKIQVVTDILESLKVRSKRQIYVFNKIDTVDYLNRRQLELDYSRYRPQFISVKEDTGITELLSVIDMVLAGNINP